MDNNFEAGKSCSDFSDLDLIFKVTVTVTMSDFVKKAYLTISFELVADVLPDMLKDILREDAE